MFPDRRVGWLALVCVAGCTFGVLLAWLISAPAAVLVAATAARAPPRAQPSDRSVESPVAAPPPRSFAHGLTITGATPHRLIMFTFDDGPDARTTPMLLDQLDSFGIKAIFFITARRIQGNSRAAISRTEIAREIIRRGHLIGNHTLQHSQLPILSVDEMAFEIDTAQDLFAHKLGVRADFLRPPGGALSSRVAEFITRRGYTTMLWNLGTGDFQVTSADEVVRTFRRVLERQERGGNRGGIVLLHDTHAWSVEAFPRIVSEMAARNCELLDTGEELFDIVSDPSFFYVQRDTENAEAIAPAARLDPAVLAQRQARLREESTLRCSAVALARASALASGADSVH